MAETQLLCHTTEGARGEHSTRELKAFAGECHCAPSPCHGLSSSYAIYGPGYAADPPSLFRLEACEDCVFSGLMDMLRVDGGSVDTYAGIGVDPRLWRMVSSRPDVGSGLWQATLPLERPALFSTGGLS